MILFLVNCLYIYYIRNRIEFSVVLLETAVEFINLYPGSVFASLAFLAVQCVWVVTWAFSFLFTYAYVWNIYNNCVANSYYGQDDNCDSSPLGGTYFGFLISLYWGGSVIMNIVHVTVAGSFASWYFLYPVQKQENPTWKSMMRALTTSFGSICLGSLIVAIVKSISYASCCYS